MTTKRNLFQHYPLNPAFFDEVFQKDGRVYPHYEDIHRQFSQLTSKDFERLNEYAKLSFLNQGITYAVYSDGHKGLSKFFLLTFSRESSLLQIGTNSKKALFSATLP
nr:hypothetical protein [Haliscomenobacter sp.]